MVSATNKQTVCIAQKTAIAFLTTFAPTPCACWFPDNNARAIKELSVSRIAIAYAQTKLVMAIAQKDTALSMVV